MHQECQRLLDYWILRGFHSEVVAIHCRTVFAYCPRNLVYVRGNHISMESEVWGCRIPLHSGWAHYHYLLARSCVEEKRNENNQILFFIEMNTGKNALASNSSYFKWREILESFWTPFLLWLAITWTKGRAQRTQGRRKRQQNMEFNADPIQEDS